MDTVRVNTIPRNTLWRALACLVVPAALSLHSPFADSQTLGRIMCKIDLIRGDGYHHHETQRWDIRGPVQACTSGPATLDCYPATWQTQGEGRLEDNWWTRSGSSTASVIRMEARSNGTIRVSRPNLQVGVFGQTYNNQSGGAINEWDLLQGRDPGPPKSPYITLPGHGIGSGSFELDVDAITNWSGFHRASCMYAFGTPAAGQDYLSAVARRTGQFDVFGLDPWDRTQIRRKTFAGLWGPGGIAGAWGPTGNGPAMGFNDVPPAAVSFSSGNAVHAATTGIDGNVYQVGLAGSCTYGCTPGTWQSLSRAAGTLFDGGVAVAATGTDEYRLFVVGESDGKVYTKAYSGGVFAPAANANWLEFGSFPTPPNTPVKQRLRLSPAAVSWGPGRFDVFATGTDDTIYWKSSVSTMGSPFESIGRLPASVSVVGSPAVASWGSGRIDVFVLGTDGKVYRKYYEGGWGPNGKTAVWESIGGPNVAVGQIVTGPSVVSWGANRLDVFVTAKNGTVYHLWYGGGWGPAWESWAGTGLASPTILATTPAAVAWGPVRLDVFSATGDRKAFHKFHANAWYPSGPGSLNGNWEAISP